MCALFRSGAFEATIAGDLVDVATVAGDTLLLVPRREDGEAWEVEPIAAAQNDAPKAHHGSRPWLGIPRMF